MRRPIPRRLLVDPVVYFVAASTAVALTRFDGGVAFLWVATAILLGRLITSSRRTWPATLAVCGVAGALATGLFGLGWPAAVPLALVNMAEAAVGAMLIRRARLPDSPLQSLGWMAGFLVAIGVVAPLVSAAGGATAVHWTVGAGWLPSFIHWFAGHALGNLTFTPIAVLLLRGDLKSWARKAGRRHAAETAALLLLVTAVSFAVFVQDALPLLFLPMLPLMLITFRVGRFGAAASVVILALIGGACTLLDRGPVSLIGGATGTHMQFFQLYLAVTVLTVLPVAADLARRGQLFRALRDSEARYRVLAETSTDIILNLDPDGCIRFVSPSIRQLGGYEPAELIGRNAGTLVAPDDLETVRTAHRATLAGGGAAFSVEYRGVTRAGETRWFETHARAIVTERGEVDGIVSVVRDISTRKELEARLAEDALTDTVTGLLNRRGFMKVLERQAALGEGCLALFDLDHFKRVNDTHGHAGGDRVLKTFADVARRTLRESDHVARIGGEEFAILLPRATVDQAELICERLRRAVAMTETCHEGRGIQVTVSGGVVAVQSSAEEALREADAALYRAKAAGRDRLALAA